MATAAEQLTATAQVQFAFSLRTLFSYDLEPWQNMTQLFTMSMLNQAQVLFFFDVSVLNVFHFSLPGAGAAASHEHDDAGHDDARDDDARDDAGALFLHCRRSRFF